MSEWHEVYVVLFSNCVVVWSQLANSEISHCNGNAESSENTSIRIHEIFKTFDR